MDAFCLIDVYRFLLRSYPSSNYIQSYRGRKPKKLDSTIARQIDINLVDANENHSESVEQSSPEITAVCLTRLNYSIDLFIFQICRTRVKLFDRIKLNLSLIICFTV